MFNFLALITKNIFWKYYSKIVKIVLLCYNIKVGEDFYIEGTPKLKIRGKSSNISIGNNVSIFGKIDLRNRNNGKIIIDDHVSIDNDCRLVAANDATLSIGKRTGIGPFTVINGGDDITIGDNCIISGMVYIQASDHGIQSNKLILRQQYLHSPITIGNDVWIGANATVTRGVRLGDGCVVGAKTLVRAGVYLKNSIIVGVPGKIVRKRDKNELEKGDHKFSG